MEKMTPIEMAIAKHEARLLDLKETIEEIKYSADENGSDIYISAYQSSVSTIEHSLTQLKSLRVVEKEFIKDLVVNAYQEAEGDVYLTKSYKYYVENYGTK